MGSSTAPPYSRLTAYDLNTGTIKWQVPVGDDLNTLSRGGPHDTGAVGLRTGIMPTKSGLVFLAGGDGKVRAYDEDDGKILWTGTLPGGSRGVPVIYQSLGREYVVIASTPGAGAAAPRARRPPCRRTPRAGTSRSRCRSKTFTTKHTKHTKVRSERSSCTSCPSW